MRIGICTPWQRRDVTYAAIQLADLFSRWGHHVSVLTSTGHPAAVSRYWDGRACPATRQKFTTWLADLDSVVWTACPRVEQVAWAEKAGKQTVLVADPADGRLIAEVYPAFHKVLAPSGCALRVLAEARLRNVVACPWSPLLPVTTRIYPVDRPARVYVPPVDRPGSTVPAAAVEVVAALLANRSGATATVSLDGRPRATAHRLRRLAHEYPGRLILLPREDYDRQLLRHGEHDVTLLTATSEVFGMTALCAVHMGTPVVGYAVAPLEEVVGGRCGVLVAGGSAGGPTRLARRLGRVVDDSLELARLRDDCPVGLISRRQAFEHALSGIAARPGVPLISRTADEPGA